MKAKLSWIRVDPEDWSLFDETRDFSSTEELITGIRQLATTFPEEAPVMAVVIRENGDTLSIGLGEPLVCPEDEDDEELSGAGLTVMNFANASFDPPYYTSLAQDPFPGTLTFFYQGSDSEFGGENAIPFDLALEAMREFVEGDGLPTRVQWEMD